MRLTTLFLRRGAAVVAFAAWLAGVANAGLMNFETASLGSLLTESFDEDGIRLSVIARHYDLWDCDSLGCPPGNGIVAGLDAVHTGPSPVRIALISGSLFNLDRIQILGSDPSTFIVASNGSLFGFDVPARRSTDFRAFSSSTFQVVRK